VGIFVVGLTTVQLTPIDFQEDVMERKKVTKTGVAGAVSIRVQPLADGRIAGRHHRKKWKAKERAD